MSLLKTFGPGEASPGIEVVYRSFLDTVGVVPATFLMLSTSPEIQARQASIIRYYREKSNLSPLLIALAGYLTAAALEMESCVEYSARELAALGLTQEQIDGIRLNPATAPMGEKDGWMLAFVVKAVQEHGVVSESHVHKLRDLGWTDTDIFDALYMSCSMLAMARMMEVLKIGD